jgi:hypothetical protein
MALAACGGKSFEVNPDPDPEGGSENGGSAQGGSGNIGGKGHGGSVGKGGTGSGATGSGGFAGSSTCDSFNDAPGYFVSVAVLNKTAAPIYLGQEMMNCGISPLFGVTDAAGAPLVRPGICSETCQMLRENEFVGCPTICASPDAIKLEPGESYYTQWDGLYQLQRTLPAVCSASTQPTGCSQAVQVQPGTFTFSSIAGSSPDCTQTTGAGCGQCNPTGNGGCTVPGGLISGQRHNATTTVYLDSSYGVWGGGPTPAPAPAFPGGGSGDIALLTVELVFAD